MMSIQPERTSLQVRKAFGQSIESEFAFDALPIAVWPSSSELSLIHLIVIRQDLLPDLPSDSTSLCHAQGRNIYVKAESDAVAIRIGSFAEFRLLPQENRIVCECLSIVPDPLLRYWILQQIIPILLLWGGKAEFLHGMSVRTKAEADVSVDTVASDTCIAFLGDSFAGKSTLLSYFLSRHHVLVGDDHLAISRKNYRDVLPATPYYRPYRAGEDLGHVADRFLPEPVPLQRIYILEPTFGYSNIATDELHGLQAIEALLPHIQYNLHNPAVPELFALVAERFSGLNRLVRQVSVKRLFVPRNLNRLPEVYDFIQNDLSERHP